MNMMSEVAIVQKRQLQFIHFQHVSKVTCGPSLIATVYAWTADHTDTSGYFY